MDWIGYDNIYIFVILMQLLECEQSQQYSIQFNFKLISTIDNSERKYYRPNDRRVTNSHQKPYIVHQNHTINGINRND